MRKINLLVALLIVVNVTLAQKDKNALAILKKVEKKGLSYKSISTNIEYRLENTQEKSDEIVKGNILVKGKKFRFIVDETETYCNGKTKWVYLTASNEVNVSDVVNTNDMEPEEQFMNNPLSVFSFYKKGFKYLLKGDENIENKKYTVIDLSPESLDKPYFKIRFWISQTSDIHAVKYFQKDGVRITLTFKKFVANVKTNDNNFVFDKTKHPKVEIIDLR